MTDHELQLKANSLHRAMLQPIAAPAQVGAGILNRETLETREGIWSGTVRVFRVVRG